MPLLVAFLSLFVADMPLLQMLFFPLFFGNKIEQCQHLVSYIALVKISDPAPPRQSSAEAVTQSHSLTVSQPVLSVVPAFRCRTKALAGQAAQKL